MAAAWPGLSEQDLGQGCGAAGSGVLSQGTRAEAEKARGRKPEWKECPCAGRGPRGTAEVAAAGPERRGSAHPSGPHTGLGAAARARAAGKLASDRQRACAHAGRAACLNSGRRRSRLG